MKIVNSKNYRAHQRRRDEQAWRLARMMLWHAPLAWLLFRVYQPTTFQLLNKF